MNCNIIPYYHSILHTITSFKQNEILYSNSPIESHNPSLWSNFWFPHWQCRVRHFFWRHFPETKRSPYPRFNQTLATYRSMSSEKSFLRWFMLMERLRGKLLHVTRRRLKTIAENYTNFNLSSELQPNVIPMIKRPDLGVIVLWQELL